MAKMKSTYKGIGLTILIGIISIILFTLRKESKPQEKIQETYEPLYLNDTASIRNEVLTIFDSLGLMDDIEQ